METKFSDDSLITDYNAVGIAEGFVESPSTDDANIIKDEIRAWSYIAGKELWRGLQGWFGRSIQNLVDNEIMNWKGEVNWNKVEELI